MKAVIGYQTLMSAGFTSVRRAVLRVVQDDAGKIVLVELVQPSTDRDLDRQALADVRAAAGRLPPPPASLLGRKAQLSSFWTFEIKLRVIPPSTGIAFEFDEKGVQPLVPFGHQVKKSVRWPRTSSRSRGQRPGIDRASPANARYCPMRRAVPRTNIAAR